MECREHLNPAILAEALPECSEILSVSQHGKTRVGREHLMTLDPDSGTEVPEGTDFRKHFSGLTHLMTHKWTDGIKVAIQVNDEEQEYFMKVVRRAEWVGMSRAEYESTKAIAAVIPDHVIDPVAWGLFDGDDSQSFFLTRFRNLRQKTPSLSHFIDIVKKLHQTSTSPTGKFGYHCTTYFGPPPMKNDWTDSWEEFWGRQYQSDIDYAQQVYGYDEELAVLTTKFIEKVVARLLRPLQTGGRVLKPVLCHGGLWDGNVHIDKATNQVVLVDTTAFYGHGEADLQSIGDPRYGLQMDVVHLYKSVIGASEPVDDFYDRHDLYVLRSDVVLAAICPEWKCLLNVIKERMRELLTKYPDGFNGFKEQKTASPQPAHEDAIDDIARSEVDSSSASVAVH